jgi:tRNA pseudouridine55 synthase
MNASQIAKKGGFVIIDKEAGITSHDAVKKAARILSQKKAGHAGTLDPTATGVLVVGLGRATRLLRYFLDLEKTYRFELVLGNSTTTYDEEGEIVNTKDPSGIGIENVKMAAEKFFGETFQVPPMYSALKQDGVRLYELARQNIEVTRSPRRIFINDIKVESTGEPHVFEITVTCSKGTYVRSLAHDIGQSLNCPSHLRRLIRLRVGPFRVEDAVSLLDLQLSDLMTCQEALYFFQQIKVGGSILSRALSGSPLKKLDLNATGDGPWVLLNEDCELVGVYEQKAPGVLMASVVFN